MDALYRIFCDAAGHTATQPGGTQITTHYVIDQTTFERHLRRACGDHPEPEERLATFFTDLLAATAPTDDEPHDETTDDPVPAPPDQDQAFRAHTIDGHPIHPADIVAAIALTNHTCNWPGCHVPVTHCQSDRIDGWAAPTRGPTNPHNGQPLCSYHSRIKQTGFTTTRHPDGTWHTHRPDGTEIT